MEEGSTKGSRIVRFLTKTSRAVTTSLERFFFVWGRTVSCRPFTFIVTCLLITFTCSLGLLSFTTENRPTKLWIPQDSGFVENTEWLQNNFPTEFRYHSVIFQADNILTPTSIKWMLKVHNEISAFVTPTGNSWNKICFRLPVVSEETVGRKKRQTSDGDFDFDFSSFDKNFDDSVFVEGPASDDFEPSVDLSPELFCDIVAGLEEACFENSILEIWKYKDEVINQLTQEDILRDMNKMNKSSLTGIEYSKLLGEVRRNNEGQIVAAKSAMVQLFTCLNLTAIENGAAMNDEGTGDTVDIMGLDWEQYLIKLLQNFTQIPAGSQQFFLAARSFGDISSATILGDVRHLVVGFAVLFVYVLINLGRLNMVENRVYLSLVGLGCVGMAIVVSYGVCSSMGVFYGPVHSILPFLLLGIGIDDMFVIIQCWNNLSPDERDKPVATRMGLALQHAGVSITVTSVTDFIAFAVGSSTVLPSLRSFCIYSAVGVIGTYVFQATFFVACFSLDQRRIESGRNGLAPCYKHKNWEPSRLSRIEPLQKFFRKYLARKLLTTPAKVCVVIVTVAAFGLNLWGSVLIRQEFNPIWFLPQTSYLYQYFKTAEAQFPSNGEFGSVYVQSSNISGHLRELDTLVQSMRNESIISQVDVWYDGFKDFVNKRYQADLPNSQMSDDNFRVYLKQYLFTQRGAKYRSKFKLTEPLQCLSQQSPPVLIFSFEFVFVPFRGREEHIPAMYRIKQLVESSPLASHGRTFVWARAFASWETDDVIMRELYRNLAMAMACVFFTTLVLIANLKACVLVLTCVLLTLVCVNGSMHFWGLTIDTVSCINLVLAIGLCVDYAAHVAHSFMTQPGTDKNERARNTVASIGPAVFHGGFSTFLAFIFLADSDSHVFTTFFKIFILVVIYGLHHGLIFLPVILSLIGPDPFPTKPHRYVDSSTGTELQLELGVDKAGEANGKSPTSMVVSEQDSAECEDTAT